MIRMVKLEDLKEDSNISNDSVVVNGSIIEEQVPTIYETMDMGDLEGSLIKLELGEINLYVAKNDKDIVGISYNTEIPEEEFSSLKDLFLNK